MTKADGIFKAVMEAYLNLISWSISHPDISYRKLFSDGAQDLFKGLQTFSEIYQIVSGERINISHTYRSKSKYSKSYLDSVVEEISPFIAPSERDCPEMGFALILVNSAIRRVQYGVQKTWNNE